MECLIISSEKMTCLIFLLFLQLQSSAFSFLQKKKDSCLVRYFCASHLTLDRLPGSTWTPPHVHSGMLGSACASSRWFRTLSSMWVLEWKCSPAVQLSKGFQLQRLNLQPQLQGPGSCWHKRGGYET